MAEDSDRTRLDFWRTMPKPDMHLHLFGAARPSTVLELAKKNGLGLKDATISLLQEGRFFDEDFRDFIHTYRDIRDCFVTRDDFERLTWETLEDASADGVSYAAIRVNWQYRNGQDLSPDMVEAIDAGRRAGEEAFGIKTRCFIDFPGWEERAYGSRCVEFTMAHRHLGIVGVDMVGLHDPMHANDIRALNRAKEAGLHVVAHSGEVEGPAEVWKVLDNFPVRRIAHGLAVAQDATLLRQVVDSDVVIEVCPVSNLCTKRIQCIEDHPANRFVDSGVPIVVGSDDPMLFRTTLSEQYAVLESKVNLSTSQLVEACKRGFEIACIDSGEKEELLHAFDKWHSEARSLESH
jgi:adenosine deaminase